MSETRIFYNTAGKWTIAQWGRAIVVMTTLDRAVEYARLTAEPNENIRIIPGY